MIDYDVNKVEKENISHTYDSNNHRPRHIHKYTK